MLEAGKALVTSQMLEQEKRVAELDREKQTAEASVAHLTKKVAQMV